MLSAQLFLHCTAYRSDETPTNPVRRSASGALRIPDGCRHSNSYFVRDELQTPCNGSREIDKQRVGTAGEPPFALRIRASQKCASCKPAIAKSLLRQLRESQQRGADYVHSVPCKREVKHAVFPQCWFGKPLALLCCATDVCSEEFRVTKNTTRGLHENELPGSSARRSMESSISAPRALAAEVYGGGAEYFPFWQLPLWPFNWIRMFAQEDQ